MNLSFETIVVLFPLLLPVWEQRPLVQADLRPSPYPERATADQIALQREAFALGGPAFRSRVAEILRRTGEPLATGQLLAQLGRETDAEVKVTILEQLAFLPLTPAVAPAAQPLLADPYGPIRRAAARLYARVPDCDVLGLGRLAAADPDLGVRLAAWEGLQAHATRVGMPFFEAYWRDPVPQVRAWAYAGAALKPQAEAKLDALLAACDDPDPIVRSALARALPKAPRAVGLRLATKLATDATAPARTQATVALVEIADPTSVPDLLRLAQDPDPEVRRLAMTGLAGFPEARVLERVAATLGDPFRLVRRAAEDAACRLHPACNVIGAVTPLMADRNQWTRQHTARVLGRVGARDAAPELLLRLPREPFPEAVAAVVFALGELQYAKAATAVADQAVHADLEVRQAVAVTLGQLRVPATYPVLSKLILDPETEVRQTAIQAAGRNGDGVFSPDLLNVLKSASGPKNIFSIGDRLAACWAAGRLRPCSREFMDYLVVHITTPVIPTSAGLVFDEDTVLVSGCFGLVQSTRDDPSLRPLADKVLAAHRRVFTEAEAATLTLKTLQASAEVRDYARQAQAWLENQTVEPRPRPTDEVDFVYRRCEPAPSPVTP